MKIIKFRYVSQSNLWGRNYDKRKFVLIRRIIFSSYCQTLFASNKSQNIQIRSWEINFLLGNWWMWKVIYLCFWWFVRFPCFANGFNWKSERGWRWWFYIWWRWMEGNLQIFIHNILFGVPDKRVFLPLHRLFSLFFALDRKVVKWLGGLWMWLAMTGTLDDRKIPDSKKLWIFFLSSLVWWNCSNGQLEEKLVLELMLRMCFRFPFLNLLYLILLLLVY